MSKDIMKDLMKDVDNPYEFGVRTALNTLCLQNLSDDVDQAKRTFPRVRFDSFKVRDEDAFILMARPLTGSTYVTWCTIIQYYTGPHFTFYTTSAMDKNGIAVRGAGVLHEIQDLSSEEKQFQYSTIASDEVLFCMGYFNACIKYNIRQHRLYPSAFIFFEKYKQMMEVLRGEL